MSDLLPLDAEQIEAFLIATGIGLLIGLERERVPSARAGLRTFGLVGMLGALVAMLGEQLGSPAPFVAGLVLVGLTIIAAYLRHPDPSDPGTTSVAALVLCYCLGAASWLGHAQVAVMLAVATTVLLYFKAQLRGMATRLEARDWISILQFGVLSLVILPMLPDEEMGPYGALNPRQIWWMVVLISGLALSGYLALRIIGTRHGAAVLGIFGGLASSTATTMMFSRHARNHADLVRMSAIVILIANVMVMIRLGLVAGVVAPHLAKPIAIVFLCGIVPGVAMALYGWKVLSGAENLPMPEVKNPTELKTAVSFGLLYALVLLASAWLQDAAGNSGLYIVALVSGLTDADASVLSTLRMFNLDKVASGEAVIAVTLALMANLVFKIGLVLSIGGGKLARHALPGLLAIGGGMAAGLLLV